MAADGGVYAELVKNRSFEFNAPLAGWTERRKDGGSGRIEEPFYVSDEAGNLCFWYGEVYEHFGFGFHRVPLSSDL